MTAAAQVLATAVGRRALSLTSMPFFDSYYCGMRYADHRTQWLERFTKTIETARETRDKARMLILAPRDHGKTEAAVTLTAHAICFDRDIRVLWISASAGQSEKRVRRVKAILESKRIVDDFCSSSKEGWTPFIQNTKKDRWMAREVYVHRQRESVDPTLQAIGLGGAITGGHFDLIICDDIEDNDSVFSSAIRAKTREWFRGTIGPMLNPGGTMIVIGTRKHHDDLYGHIVDNAAWHVIEDKAILQWPESHRFITTPDARGRDVITGIEVTGEAKVLWPAERNIEYLLKERHIVGSVMFSREFQNEVQDDSAAAFRMAWLNAALERGKHMSLYEIPDVPGLEIVQGWDLALVTDAKHAESRDTDYTVGVTWARDANGNRYLLGLRRERGLTPAKIEGIVKSEFARFGLRVRSVAVERNNFGELIYLGLQTSTDLPLKGHITGRNKADPWEGVPAMGVLFENGKVIIPSRTEEDRTTVEPLINELWGLGREIHDDTVMSLWIAETVLRAGSFVHRVSFSDDDELYGAADDRMHRADGQQERSAPAGDQPYVDEHVQALWNSLPIGQGDR